MKMVLDKKEDSLPQEDSPELLEHALNMLKARADNKTDEPTKEIDEPTKEIDEPITENLTPTEKD
jgi:hypothetical protein